MTALLTSGLQRLTQTSATTFQTFPHKRSAALRCYRQRRRGHPERRMDTMHYEMHDHIHRPGAGVLVPSREFWNRQLCRFAAQFVKPLSALCVCTGFVWDL
jgi:hypothetical protein